MFMSFRRPNETRSDLRGGAISARWKPDHTSDQLRYAEAPHSTVLTRNPAALARNTYDVAVIGAGIYGISVARDAALRGLTVVLFDCGDFGHATSSNHHRIIHGGLRYLQHADVRRMRESIRERSVLLRIAPHLVRPMPFLIPTCERPLQGKMSMYLALKLNDWVSADRNRHLQSRQQIPNGRMISRAECIKLWADLDQPHVTGGALFFDAQVRNPNRLNLALLSSAAGAGARVANYVEVTGFVRHGTSVAGIDVRDVLSGNTFSVRARVVVNCAGPWNEQLLGTLSRTKRAQPLCKSLVLVTRSLGAGEVAVGVPSRFVYTDKDAVVKKGFRYFFITPWRNRSLIGTFQTPYTGAPEALAASEGEINDAMDQFNAAFPTPRLKRADIVSVFQGLVPSDEDGRGADLQLKKHPEVVDHAVSDGIEGLVSVIGVKYTTARGVAEKVVDRIFKKLHRRSPRCRTAEKPIEGAFVDPAVVSRLLKMPPAHMDAECLQHLMETHGAAYGAILRYADADPRWLDRIVSDCPIVKAQVLHGVRSEMAQKLGDIVFRRTDLAISGHANERTIDTCGKIMADELGWGRQRLMQEVEEVRRSLAGAVHADN